MQFSYHVAILLVCLCVIANIEHCTGQVTANENEKWSRYLALISSAVANYTGCSSADSCYDDVISTDLSPWLSRGIRQSDIDRARTTLATHYQIINHRLYRNKRCVFTARCEGVEHFLLPLAKELPDMDIALNVFDHPQVNKYTEPSPVFSFSRDSGHVDIMYPAWTFWAGGPAVWPIYPTGLGRWDEQREIITKKAKKFPWERKESKAFFRGSRTSAERDPLVLYSRKHPDLAEAAYTKNQAYKSEKDTLGAAPAKEIPLDDHCPYKYLFNFRGVAASFRLKHLFLCRSLVFHVGEDWLEFFYPALKPWVHYIPMSTDLRDLEDLLEFARENDAVAYDIAERGFEFIWNHLRNSDVKVYWRKLLTTYASALKYKPKLETKDMIEITATT